MKVQALALGVCLMLTATSVSSRQSPTVQTETQPPKPTLGNCEDNVSLLSQAHHLAGADGTIIAIARLGDGERSRELSARRLHNVRVFLTEFGWQRAPETVITAEGSRAKGYGRVEVYVKGWLFAILAVKNNQDLLVGSCEPANLRPVKAEGNLYPYLKRRPTRE